MLIGKKTHYLTSSLFLCCLGEKKKKKLSIIGGPYNFPHVGMHIASNEKGLVDHIFPTSSYLRGISNNGFFFSHLSSDLQIRQLAKMSLYLY